VPELEVGRVAEILVTLAADSAERRGSGYRVTAETVLTAAHVVDGASRVRVRFDADRPGEWSAGVATVATLPEIDIALLTITSPDAGEVVPAQFGRIAERDAVIECSAVGFPLWKLRDDPAGPYRDSAHVAGTAAVLANRKEESSLEITVTPPERSPDPHVSPWQGMSGAAVFCNGRIIGVINRHYPAEGLGRLTASRADAWHRKLNAAQREQLLTQLGIADGESLVDVVPPPAGLRTRTGYLEQVRDIAPARGLLDRQAELDELTGFCAGDEPYVWWQAGPWAGKTALMSSFALNPPAGVDVVSFFITARLAAQNDSNAFTDALLDQLAVLVGESLPASLTTATARDAHRRALLKAAGVRSRQSGRPLVLVVDGLDEDRGSLPGSGLASIASLLPKTPEPGMRIIVAGRPSPEIPSDVPGDHPLRTCRLRLLDTSPHATEIIRLARRELDELLAGDRVHREVIGLISASGGGLAVPDLEELTGQPHYRLENMTGGVFGRTIAERADLSAAGLERVLLFAHETLRDEAASRLGRVHLDGYRERIFVWADTYRYWPAVTPLYLLRGYPQMLADLVRDRPDELQAADGLRRLVTLATDATRHDRMRELTGGDAAALTEVTSAQAATLARSSPDLLAMIRLAIHRGDLSSRNVHIPIGLPAVLSGLGQVARAEALACSITDPYARVEALASLMQAAAIAGDHEHAATLAATAESIARDITDPEDRLSAMAAIIIRLAGCGEADQAESVARKVTDPDEQALAYAALAQALAEAGDSARAEVVAGSLAEPDLRAKVLCIVALAAARAGERARALSLANRARADTAGIEEAEAQLGVWTALAEVAAAAGDHGTALAFAAEAETAARGLDGPDRYEALTAVSETLLGLARDIAASGDHEQAAEVAHDAEMAGNDIENPFMRHQAVAGVYDVMVDLVRAAARDGELDRAESLAREISNPSRQVEALAVLAQECAAAGAARRAAALSGTVEAAVRAESGADWQIRMLTILAQGAAAGADQRRAEAVFGLAEEIARGAATGRREQAAIAAVLSQTAAAAGDYRHAAVIIGNAAAAADGITDQRQRGGALADLGEAAADLVRAAAKAGQHDHASAIARSIPDPAWQAQLLRVNLLAAIRAGARDRASELAAAAKAVAEDITDPAEQVRALTKLAEAMTELAAAWAQAGDKDRAIAVATTAENLAVTITNLGDRALAWAELTRAVAAAGDNGRVAALASATEALAQTIGDPYQQSMTLIIIAEALTVTGEVGRAAALADLARDIARDIPTANDRSLVQEAIVHAAAALAQKEAANGGYDSAVALLRSADADAIYNLDDRKQAQATVVEAVVSLAEGAVTAGSPLQARAITRIITDPYQLEHVMEGLADAAAARSQAGQLAALIETYARDVTEPGHRVQAMCQLARALAAAGDYDRVAATLATAAASAGKMADELSKDQAIRGVADAEIGVVEVAAAVGDYDRAVALAYGLRYPSRQVRALTVVARAATVSGEVARARAVISAAQEIAGRISDPGNRAQAMTLVVEAAIDPGHVAELASAAESTAENITDPRWRAEAMAGLARAVAAAGDHSLAARVASETAALAHEIPYVHDRIEVLTGTAATMAAAGYSSRARQAARSVLELAHGEDLMEQHRVRGALLEAIAEAGGYDLAESLIADSIDDPSDQTRYLVWLAQTACANGSIDHAEAILGRIGEPGPRSRAAASVASEVARSDIDRAEEIARTITDPDDQASAYAAIAEYAGPDRARTLAALALNSGDWTLPLMVIARTDPHIVATVADEQASRAMTRRPAHAQSADRSKARQATADDSRQPGPGGAGPGPGPGVAAQFLTARSGDSDQDAALALAGELGELPLALQQAAAYMQATGTSLARYLSLFRTRQAGLVDRGQVAGHRDHVAVTLGLALDRLGPDAPAAGLLRLLAFLAPEPVPPGLLLAGQDAARQLGAETARALGPLLGDPVAAGDAVTALRRYSLAAPAGDGLVQVHPLVQAVTCAQLTATEAAQWKQAAAAVVEAAIPADGQLPAAWPTCAVLLPHARVVLDLTSSGIRQVGRSLGFSGSYAAARDLFALIADACRDSGNYGPAHPRTLDARQELAFWTGRAGDAAGARDQHAALLPVYQRVLGPEHPDTLMVRSNLASWTGQAGDAAGARDQYAALLPVYQRVLGPEHPDTLTARGNLASWTGRTGDAAGARDRCAALLPVYQRVLGPEHPETLTIDGNLASWTGEAGDAAGARDQYAALLPVYQRVLDPEHPETLNVHDNLASWTGRTGDAAGARDQYAALLSVYQRVLGPEHPETLTIGDNLAGWIGEAGDAAGARDQYAALLPVYQRVLGPEHLETLNVNGNLAHHTGQAGNAAGARDQYAALLPVYQRVLDPEHPETLNVHDNLARWTAETGDAAGARDQYAALLRLCQRVLGPEHPETLTIGGNLAWWTGEAGDAAGARDQYAALLRLRQRVLGPEHPDTLTARDNLAYYTEQTRDTDW
jgi:hypothetical protein